MQAPKVKDKSMRLPGAHMIFSKINAVLQTTKTFIVGSEKIGSALTYEATNGYRVRQLEVERLKTKAEEYAQTLRQRFV